MTTAVNTISPANTIENNVRTASSPSELRITDIRVATVVGAGYFPIVRIDTNQGVSGLGEVRDAADPFYALQLRPLIISQNPCNVDYLFKLLKEFGGDSRRAGGVCAIEIALMDLVGKVYGVPCYQLLGGKYRDRVRIYGDTPTPRDMTPAGFAEAVRSRREMGLTFIKFDLSPRLFENEPGALIGSDTLHEYEKKRQRYATGSGAGARISQRAIELAAEVAAAVRAEVGPDVSLCTDHFGEGFVTAKEAIRLGRALEPYDLAWIEDPMPWTDIAGHKKVTDSIQTPVAAGEDWYLWEGFREAIETRAVDIIHPDMLTSGGLTETKKIADHAERYGIPTALHACCSPVGMMANVHLAASISSLVAVEHHGLDLPYFTSLVTGIADDYLQDGYVAVPDTPGLGIELDEEMIREHLRPGTEYMADTSAWNNVRVGAEFISGD